MVGSDISPMRVQVGERRGVSPPVEARWTAGSRRAARLHPEGDSPSGLVHQNSPLAWSGPWVRGPATYICSEGLSGLMPAARKRSATLSLNFVLLRANNPAGFFST